jgi:hypothetical protein
VSTTARPRKTRVGRVFWLARDPGLGLGLGRSGPGSGVRAPKVVRVQQAWTDGLTDRSRLFFLISLSKFNLK